MKTSDSIKEIAVALHKFHGLMGKDRRRRRAVSFILLLI